MGTKRDAKGVERLGDESLSLQPTREGLKEAILLLSKRDRTPVVTNFTKRLQNDRIDFTP